MDGKFDTLFAVANAARSSLARGQEKRNECAGEESMSEGKAKTWFWAAAGLVAIQLVARPDPLVFYAPLEWHSADTDHNSRVSLLELTRVIELYNVRNGSTRTGSYAVAVATSEDGFVPDPVRAATAVVTLANTHSADTNRDGRLGLVELTRVIELSNVRIGSVRTGEYRLQAGTEDGFAPGP